MDNQPNSQEKQVEQQQVMEVEQDVADQFIDSQMQQVSQHHQTLQGGVNSVKKSIAKQSNMSNAQQAQIAAQKKAQMQQPIQQQQFQQPSFSNAQQAQMADQKRAQVQANKMSKPVQQMPQQQMQQQRPISRQQQQQAQNNNQGVFGQIKNYVSNLFGSDQGNAADFQYIPTNNFNDDDDIIQPENLHVKEQQINIEELVELKVQAQYDYGKLKKSEGQTLPAMVSIITKDIEQFAKNNSTIEAGIDLICVIDKSGSMSGGKIKSVQQSLIQLLDFLSAKDRLCLILFNGGAQRLTPLKSLTAENKKYFKNAIATIRADGGTNIPMGTSLAFRQIRERKMKNQVTSIFLLSDGQDTGADLRIKEQKSQIEDVVTIHSFGYGSDHDAALMSSICKVGQGSFYYIQDIKLLDEFFADALGRLASALAEKIQIDIKCSPPEPFQRIEITNTFGDMWKQIDKGRFYSINVPQIASDARKDYVFEFGLPPYVDQINDEQRAPVILQVYMQFKNTFSNQVYQKQAQLQLKLYNEEEQLADNDPNQEVTKEYLRVYATNVIEQARMKCEQSKNEEAEQMLEKIQQNIMTDQKLAKVSAQAIQDLTQAKNASKRQNFQQFGKNQMCQMSVNNYQQEGLNAQFDDLGGQMQQIEQGMFQNKKQLKMVQQVQKRKS